MSCQVLPSLDHRQRRHANVVLGSAQLRLHWQARAFRLSAQGMLTGSAGSTIEQIHWTMTAVA